MLRWTSAPQGRMYKRFSNCKVRAIIKFYKQSSIADARSISINSRPSQTFCVLCSRPSRRNMPARLAPICGEAGEICSCRGRDFYWNFLRNPLQNFRCFVIGVQDRNYTVTGRAPVMRDPHPHSVGVSVLFR